jgi:hypothetical protein
VSRADGGVTVPVHFFVVDHCNADLLLGRPWEGITRAKYENLEDGSCMVTIHSVGNDKQVTFEALRAGHERVRRNVRSPEAIRARELPLKA